MHDELSQSINTLVFQKIWLLHDMA